MTAWVERSTSLFEADRAALLTEVVLAVAKRFAVQLERAP